LLLQGLITMKAAILLVAGSVGLFASPAVAGNSKKREIKKPTIAAVEKTEIAVPATELSAAAVVGELPDSPEMLAMPSLPADLSSPLVPFPELEKKLLSPAAKPMKAHKGKAPTMKMGKDYVLGRRESAKPGAEAEHIIPKSLSQSQVATVVQSHMSDIQSCWNAVPRQLRVDACTADLKLSISDAGVVTDIELGGDVPASAHKCITSAIARWSFPVTEAKSEVEYGISLRSL
jgi:hypothetical protein